MESRPFRLLRNLSRTRDIVTVLLNHGFGDLVDRVGLRDFWYRCFRMFHRQSPPPLRSLKTVERIRLTLESLGPTFIKFGQVMSTRPDLIPRDMLLELEKLQESVPPFPSELAIAEVERELGAPVGELFAVFQTEPLAAGSLGQVHRAVHKDGTPLAVKIRRPTAVRDVERDLSLMQELARLAEGHIPEAAVFDPVGLVNHFARSIRRELNFAREGRSMDEFARVFRRDATLYVPKVYWELTTDAVLTMEFIDGYRIDDTDALQSLGIEPAQIAANGARIFMKQAFDYGIFHGDPHPGNIRVRSDGSLCLLDYGLIGMLEPEMRAQLIDLLIAVSQQDVEAAMDLVLRIGEAPREMDLPLLRVDLRDFMANYYGVPLERLNVGNMLSDFVSILSTHGIHCPGSLLLLIRALVTLEGIGRQLDPQFNLAGHLQPFVEQIVRNRYSPKELLERFWKQSRSVAEIAGELPRQIGTAFEKLATDDLRIQLEHKGLHHLVLELERSSNRLVVGMVVAALIVASAFVLRDSLHSAWLSVPIYFLSSLLALWLVYGIFRSGRL